MNSEIEIEVGEYIRTNEGMIAQYLGFDKKYNWHVFNKKIKWHYEYYTSEIDGSEEWKDFKETVVKHSKNLIDLIELGDYIILFDDNLPAEYIYQIIIDKDNNCQINDYKNIKKEDIKSIVAKEQFKSIECVV